MFFQRNAQVIGVSWETRAPLYMSWLNTRSGFSTLDGLLVQKTFPSPSKASVAIFAGFFPQIFLLISRDFSVLYIFEASSCFSALSIPPSQSPQILYNHGHEQKAAEPDELLTSRLLVKHKYGLDLLQQNLFPNALSSPKTSIKLLIKYFAGVLKPNHFVSILYVHNREVKS